MTQPKISLFLTWDSLFKKTKMNLNLSETPLRAMATNILYSLKLKIKYFKKIFMTKRGGDRRNLGMFSNRSEATNLASIIKVSQF